MKVLVLIALLIAAIVAVATGQENTTTGSPTVFVEGNATDSPTEGDLNPDEDKTESDFSLPRTFMPALIVVGLMFLGRCLLYFFFTEEQNQYMMGPNTGMYLTTKKPHLTLLEIDTYTEKFKFSSEHEHVLEHRILENLTAEPSADEEEFVCAICIDSFAEEDDCRRLPCGHFFHADCVDEWFDRSIECPLCKQDVHKAYDARKKGKSPGSKEEGGNGNRRLSGGLRSQFTRMLSARSAPPPTTNGAEVDLESALETEDGKKQQRGLRNGLQKLLSAASLGAKEEAAPAPAPNEVQVVVPKDNHRIYGDDDEEGEDSQEMEGSDPEDSENDNEKDDAAGSKEDKLSEADKIRRSLEDEL